MALDSRWRQARLPITRAYKAKSWQQRAAISMARVAVVLIRELRLGARITTETAKITDHDAAHSLVIFLPSKERPAKSRSR